METRTNGIKTTALQLRAGDVYYTGAGGYALFIARGEHPIYPNMQIVVWCDARGVLTLEAKYPNEAMPGVVINKGEPPSVRASRFRRWYLERKAR